MPQAHGLKFFFNSFLHICLLPWTWKIFLIKIFSAIPQATGLRKFSFKKNFIHHASGPWT